MDELGLPYFPTIAAATRFDGVARATIPYRMRAWCAERPRLHTIRAGAQHDPGTYSGSYACALWAARILGMAGNASRQATIDNILAANLAGVFTLAALEGLDARGLLRLALRLEVLVRDSHSVDDL